MVAEIFEGEIKRVTQTTTTVKINWEFTRTRKRGPSNRPELRSLRELKKGLTDGLK